MEFNFDEDILDYEEDDFNFDDTPTTRVDGNQDDNLTGFDDDDFNLNINEKNSGECENLNSKQLPSTSVNTENNAVEGDGQQVKTDFVDNESAKTDANVVPPKNTFTQKENGSNCTGTESLGKKRKRSRPFRVLPGKKKKFGESVFNSFPKFTNNQKRGRNFAASDAVNNCDRSSWLSYFNGLPIFFGKKPETVRNDSLNLERANANTLNTNNNYKKAVEYYTKNKTLAESEKEMIKMKKEARVKRFMNDLRSQEIGQATRCVQGKVPKTNDLYFEKEYFIKMEEQKRQREKIMSLKDKQRDLGNFDVFGSSDLQMNHHACKDCLLEKKNPFDTYSEATLPIFGAKIKQEMVEVEEDIKPQIFQGNYANHSFELPTQVLKNGFNHFVKPKIGDEELFVYKKDTNTDDEGLCVYKKDSYTGVKFVRTISKTFDELKLSKIK